MREEEFELARRELCSDDRCIGLVGPDGRCKVCGLVSPLAVADPRHRGMRVAGDQDAEEGDEDDRELCPDGTCVGLIGDDGRCKVCGAVSAGGHREVAGGTTVRREVAGAAAVRVDLDGEPGGEEGDDEERELCPDGGCIGLIGGDGRCKVCGAARAPAGS